MKIDTRSEGWGSLTNSRNAHYFRDGRSLCGGWLVLTDPQWERNQTLGAEASEGTCKKCWKKLSKEGHAQDSKNG